MAEHRDIARARRLARSKGLVLHKIPDGGDSYDVQQCSIRGGQCKASRYELERGHWRSHYSAAGGNLAEVLEFLNSHVPDDH